MTATATASIDAATEKSEALTVDRPWANSAPPNPATAPAITFACTVTRIADTDIALAACSLSRTATSLRPNAPTRRFLRASRTIARHTSDTCTNSPISGECNGRPGTIPSGPSNHG